MTITEIANALGQVHYNAALATPEGAPGAFFWSEYLQLILLYCLQRLTCSVPKYQLTQVVSNVLDTICPRPPPHLEQLVDWAKEQ